MLPYNSPVRIGLAIMLSSLCACGRTKSDIGADPAKADLNDAQAHDAPADVSREDTDAVRTLIGPTSGPKKTGEIVVRSEDAATFGAAVSFELGLCYSDALLRDEGVAGVVTVRFSLRVDGGVEAPAAGGKGIDDAELLRCVVAVVRRVRFDPPPHDFDPRSYAFYFTRSAL